MDDADMVAINKKLRKRVSINIAVFNEQDYIIPTLKRFLNQDYPKNLFELIIVDNNCTDKTIFLTKVFAKKFTDLNIRIVKEKRQGIKYARKKGLNLGLSADYLVTIDAETLVPPNFISQTIDIFQNNKADGVAWKLKLPWDIFLKFPEVMRKNISFFIQRREKIKSFLELYFGPLLEGSCFAITSKIYRLVGGMPLSGGFLRYNDDVILSKRIVYSNGRILPSKGYVVVSGRRMLTDIRGYLSGKSHWGREELKFPRVKGKKTPFLSDEDFDTLWEERLKISAEIFLRHILDLLLYYQQHPDNKIVERMIQKSVKLSGFSLESCLAMTKDKKQEKIFDTFKHRFQNVIKQKIKAYVEKEILH